MKKFRIILFKVLLFALLPPVLTACGQKEGKVLSQKKMAAVLTDVYLTEALLQNVDKKKKTDWSRGLEDNFFQDLAYRRILEKHHISEEVFYNSVAHYSQQYKVYAKIYAQVELNMKALQEEMNEREKLQTQLREQAQKQAQLIAVLDTASYSKWFKIWSIDSVSVPDSVYMPDSVVSGTDSLYLLPLTDFKRYEITYWLRSYSSDSCEWTVVEFKQPAINEQPEPPGTKAFLREQISKELTPVRN